MLMILPGNYLFCMYCNFVSVSTTVKFDTLLNIQPIAQTIYIFISNFLECKRKFQKDQYNIPLLGFALFMIFTHIQPIQESESVNSLLFPPFRRKATEVKLRYFNNILE